MHAQEAHTFRVGITVLRATSVAAMLTGAFFLLGRSSATEVFERLYYGDGAVQGQAHLVLAYGVVGAVMIGWFVLVWCGVGRMAAGDTRRWNELAWSFGTWAVLDTAHSVIAGSLGNVVLNIAFVTAMFVGLWLTRSSRDWADDGAAT